MMPLLPQTERGAVNQRRHRLDDPEGIYAELDGPRPDPLGMLLVNVHPIERLRHRLGQVATLRQALHSLQIAPQPHPSVMSSTTSGDGDHCP